MLSFVHRFAIFFKFLFKKLGVYNKVWGTIVRKEFLLNEYQTTTREIKTIGIRKLI